MQLSNTLGIDHYSPYPLINDDAVFGLTSTIVTNNVGSTIARHLPQRDAARATLFLHGAAGSWSTWTPVLLAARDAGISIPDPVLFDLPGWGAAELNGTTDATTIDAVCELVRETALKLGYVQWDLVGHSMGGFIALHMAARWPENVRSVVTVSGTTWSLVESVRHPVSSFGSLPGFVMLWRVMGVLAALGLVGRALLQALDACRLLRLALTPLFRHPFRVAESVIDAFSHEIRPRSFVSAAEITREYDPNAAWAAITCSITAIKGDRDVFVRDSDLTSLSSLLPHARIITVPDCGHFANVERPTAMLQAIITGR